jgi:PAS domain S-box-containing protein
MKTTRVTDAASRTNGDAASRTNGGSPNGEVSQAFRALEVLDWLRQNDEQERMTHPELDSEARTYLELFDFAPGSYVVTDIDGVIRLANLATGDMLSVRQDRLVDTPLVELVETESRDAFRRCLGRLQGGEAVNGWATRLEPSTGPPVDVFVAVNRGWDGDGARVLRWLFHDITERKQRQRQRAALLLQMTARAASVEGAGDHPNLR